jgi:hypothetical protein
MEGAERAAASRNLTDVSEANAGFCTYTYMSVGFVIRAVPMLPEP